MALDGMSKRFVVDIPVTEVFVVDKEQFLRYEGVLSQSKSKVDGWKFVNNFGKSEWPLAVRSCASHEAVSGLCGFPKPRFEDAKVEESLLSDCQSMEVFGREARTIYSQVSAEEGIEVVKMARFCCDGMIRRVSYYVTCVGLDEFVPSVRVCPELQRVVLQAKLSVVSLQSWLLSLTNDAAFGCQCQSSEVDKQSDIDGEDSEESEESGSEVESSEQGEESDSELSVM